MGTQESRVNKEEEQTEDENAQMVVRSNDQESQGHSISASEEQATARRSSQSKKENAWSTVPLNSKQQHKQRRKGLVMASATTCIDQRSIMLIANNTGSIPSTFVLNGLAGLEAYFFWFVSPLLAVYFVTVLGNCTILLVIKTAVNLHKPMYAFVSQLAITDLTMSSCVLPKLLAIFWSNDTEIYFSSCLIQMFFIIFSLTQETSILSAMAFDRYIAVCNPLRYSTILTNSLMAKIIAATLARSIFLVAPIPILILRLPFCSRNVPQTFCEHMAVVKLSCADITVNNVYSLAFSYLIVPVDIMCIASSYILILRTIMHLPFREERFKAFHTCGSHICVMSAFYVPLLFTTLSHRMNHRIPVYIQVIMSNTGLLLSPLMNPVIYGVILRELRQGLNQTLQFFRMHIPLETQLGAVPDGALVIITPEASSELVQDHELTPHSGNLYDSVQKAWYSVIKKV
ncbi:olfactory receptor 52E4-like [Pleurodeles waltl]|uniref:olfactory receptor 52E4-like n=1 Tax=Pleurodeles waltl TaxID=8319 RepID=UPI00370955D2